MTRCYREKTRKDAQHTLGNFFLHHSYQLLPDPTSTLVQYILYKCPQREDTVSM